MWISNWFLNILLLFWGFSLFGVSSLEGPSPLCRLLYPQKMLSQVDIMQYSLRSHQRGTEGEFFSRAAKLVGGERLKHRKSVIYICS